MQSYRFQALFAWGAPRCLIWLQQPDVLSSTLKISVEWCSGILLKAYRAGETANAGSFSPFTSHLRDWDCKMADTYTSIATAVLTAGMRFLAPPTK